MITISLCMIVKNEEAVLARCLDSVSDIVDEIIIADTGSTDRTREIAQAYTPHVLRFDWINDFAAARNFAYAQATMDYQMWLDADDVVPPEEGEKLRALKETMDPAVDLVTMQYHTHFDSTGAPVLTSTRERLTRRAKQYRWMDPVHECIPLSGNILHSDIAIWHKKPASSDVSTRNLDIYEALEQQGTSFTPRQLYYFARELKDHQRWAKASYYFGRFLRTKEGWVEDNIAACRNLAICYQMLGEEEKVLPTLLESFQFASPRAEICCQIGYYYKRKKDYATALDWFQIAARLDPPRSLGFVLQDYWGYIPHLESCVCCCNLAQYEKARQYNHLAGRCKPNSAAVLHNQRFLSQIESIH